MRPFHHARASATRSNRNWRDDLEVHEFLDSSKVAFPDLRHRMILHSIDLGAELAARAFPDRTDISTIVRDHVVEDVGSERTLGDWLAHCNLEKLPKLHPAMLPVNEGDLIAEEQERLGLPDDSGPRAVIDILRLPCLFAPEYKEHSWCILANSFGPALVQRILGGPTEIEGMSGKKVVFDPAWCAEGIIYRLFRTIPELRSVAMTLRTSPTGLK